MILCIIRLVRSYIMYAHTGVAILYLVCTHAYYIIYIYIWLQQLYFLIDDSCLFLSDPWIFARSPHVCTRIRIRSPLNTPHCYLKLDYLSCLLFPLLRRGARSIVIYWIVWHLFFTLELAFDKPRFFKTTLKKIISSTSTWLRPIQNSNAHETETKI